MKQTYEDSEKRYKAVKICHMLNDSGTPCSIKRVQRHMTEQGLRSIMVKNTITMPILAVSQTVRTNLEKAGWKIDYFITHC